MDQMALLHEYQSVISGLIWAKINEIQAEINANHEDLVIAAWEALGKKDLYLKRKELANELNTLDTELNKSRVCQNGAQQVPYPYPPTLSPAMQYYPQVPASYPQNNFVVAATDYEKAYSKVRDTNYPTLVKLNKLLASLHERLLWCVDGPEFVMEFRLLKDEISAL
jgi:hypothetical protein